MIRAPNSLNLNCKERVMKEAPGPSVSKEIADIFTNYNIDLVPPVKPHDRNIATYAGHAVVQWRTYFNWVTG